MNTTPSQLHTFAVAAACRWWRSSAKLLKQLSGAPLEVAEAVRQQLQAFQQHVPLIAALRNPGLRDRHWEKISAAVGLPVKADAGTQFPKSISILCMQQAQSVSASSHAYTAAFAHSCKCKHTYALPVPSCVLLTLSCHLLPHSFQPEPRVAAWAAFPHGGHRGGLRVCQQSACCADCVVGSQP